jgi:hypothetical protein
MEDILDLYAEPYDRRYPLVCFDKRLYQLVSETRQALPVRPGQPLRYDYQYHREWTCNLFMCFEPLRGWRHVEVTDRRTARDFATCMKDLVDVHFPEAAVISVGLDNLNTHIPAALYVTFRPAEARRIMRKLDLHYTPKHGSWLNMAEIELAVLSTQCLDPRLGDQATVHRTIAAWERDRNAAQASVNWQFTPAKRLSQYARLTVGNIGTRQMQKPQIVPRFLVPADQQPPEPVHPTVRALYDPPSCPESGFLLQRLRFLTPGPDVGREPKLGEQVAHLIRVIAFVQAHPLGRRWGWLRPLDGHTFDGLPRHFEVMTIRPSHCEADGHAAAVGEDAPFGPDLPAICGVFADFFPPKGRFGHGPIHREPCPVNPLQGIVFPQAPLPQRQEDASLRPLLEAAMGRTTGAEARVVQGIPLATGPQDEENGIHGPTIIDAGPMAPQGVRFTRREQWRDALPQLVRDTPIPAGFLVAVIHQCGSCRRDFPYRISSK